MIRTTSLLLILLLSGCHRMLDEPHATAVGESGEPSATAGGPDPAQPDAPEGRPSVPLGDADAAPGEPPEGRPRPGEEEGPRADDIDSVGDRGDPIPFGVALRLAEGEAELLYPNLIGAAVAPARLLPTLPARAAGLRRMETRAGVQEDSFSAWVGALGTYRGAAGKVTLLVEDTGWEPVAVNRWLAAWAGANASLPDGRPVASLDPGERGGQFAQVPVDLARPRLLLQAHAAEGVDREVLLAALGDVELPPLLALLDAGGPFVDSALLPADRSALIDPARLSRALPQVLGLSLVQEGHGWRREQRRDLVSEAMRTYLRPDGVIQVSLRDLGEPGHGRSVGGVGDGTGSGDEIRRRAGGAVRCAPDVGACKYVEVLKDRLVWSVVGPADRAAVQAVASSLDRAALP